MNKAQKKILFKRARRRLQKYRKKPDNHKEGIDRALSDIRFATN